MVEVGPPPDAIDALLRGGGVVPSPVALIKNSSGQNELSPSLRLDAEVGVYVVANRVVGIRPPQERQIYARIPPEPAAVDGIGVGRAVAGWVTGQP